MKNLFVSQEIAEKLKEKGFDEPCLAIYWRSGSMTFCMDAPENNCLRRNSEHGDLEYCGVSSAPLYQQVVDWLYDKHEVWITVNNYNHCEPTDKLPTGFTFFIQVFGVCEFGEKASGYSKTHYEALDKAFVEAIKLIEE